MSTKTQDRVAHVVGLFIAQALLLPLGGWALMLLLGILHSHVQAIPVLSFWICVALVGLASCVKSAVAPNFPDE